MNKWAAVWRKGHLVAVEIYCRAAVHVLFQVNPQVRACNHRWHLECEAVRLAQMCTLPRPIMSGSFPPCPEEPKCLRTSQAALYRRRFEESDIWKTVHLQRTRPRWTIIYFSWASGAGVALILKKYFPMIFTANAVQWNYVHEWLWCLVLSKQVKITRWSQKDPGRVHWSTSPRFKSPCSKCHIFTMLVWLVF